MKNRVPLSEYKTLDHFKEEEKNAHFETQYIDEEILFLAINFYNSYFGYFKHPINVEEALNYADLGARLNADLWKSMMPMSHEKMELFYKITPFYFFHDILRFMDGIHRANFDKWTSERPEVKSVLDFAGGTGGYSIMYAKKGIPVTFVDSNKIQSEWVRFIAHYLKIPITVKNTLDEIEGVFDGVIAQDVIEHVFNPTEVSTKLMSFVSKKNPEKAFISISEVPCCGPEEFAPMHFKVDFDGTNISFKFLEHYLGMDMTLPQYRGLMKQNADQSDKTVSDNSGKG